MSEKQGEWYCWISGNIKGAGDICEINPRAKQKCRECVNLKFMKFEVKK